MEINDTGAWKLLQAIIQNAYAAVTSPQQLCPGDAKKRKQVVQRAIEFAKRRPNRFIETYAQMAEVDEKIIRNGIVSTGEKKLEQLK